MPDYMLMVLEDEEAHAEQPAKTMAELIQGRARFSDELRRSGQLQDGARFRPSAEGKRVRRAGGELHVEDGPFSEGGKALGGYYSVRAPSIGEAAEIGTHCPALPADEVDVRPIMKGGVDADKGGKTGKVFSFVVLGRAPTGEEWVKVMDRIDEETSGCFPPGAFLGGVRLQPPMAGRRVVTRGERRATFDGPFLESKEVIGGVFFLRMPDLDEAVRWAGHSRFVVHGALEIRELWRS